MFYIEPTANDELWHFNMNMSAQIDIDCLKCDGSCEHSWEDLKDFCLKYLYINDAVELHFRKYQFQNGKEVFFRKKHRDIFDAEGKIDGTLILSYLPRWKHVPPQPMDFNELMEDVRGEQWMPTFTHHHRNTGMNTNDSMLNYA